MYVFDDKGALITPRNINLKSRFLAAKLWSMLEASYEEKSNFAYKYRKQLNSFLGKDFKLGPFIDNRNCLIPLIVNAKTAYIYWMNNPKSHKNGILMIFWDTPSFELRFNQIINRYYSKFDATFARYNNGIVKSFPNDKVENDYDNIFLQTVLKDNQDGYIDSKGLLWKYIKLDELNFIAGMQSKANEYNDYHFKFILTAFMLGIIITIIYILIIKSKEYYFSIKAKLIILFFTAVFTPVMGFSFLGYKYISYMKENLIAKFGKESRDLLLNIDRELGASGNAFRDDFRKMVREFQDYNEKEEYRKNFAKSLETNDLAVIERRLASDATIINQLTNHVIVEGLTVVTDPFSKCCLDTMFNSTLMDSVDPILRNAMQSPELGMSIFWNSPDFVQIFVFGDLEFYLYWSLAKSEKYGQEYYFIMRRTDRVLRNFIPQRLKACKTNIKEREYKIFACNNERNEWFPNKSYSKALKTISRRINYTGKPIETEIDINSEHYLLLGIKSDKLRGYSFYALYPYENIENELSKAIYYFAISILVFILFALFLGYRLAQTFLNPVNQLKNGVEAIKERNTNFRIEVLQNDEFGGLANSFNKMIENFKEMELAKDVQESLLPQKLPIVDGYQLSFSNKMASGVGGDYFDTMLLDKDNLCVIIGDVSGHGVASALVMAIAKATLYHGFNKTRNLIELFTNLNSVINIYFNKPPAKKMITLFATIINLPTGKATFLDAGHNYPMKISVNGEISEIKMVGVPVGILKKFKAKTVNEFTIENGETVVFYTDGIVEATGKTEEQYGYTRFKDSLSKMVKCNSEEIKNTLLKEYEIWEDGTEPDDDVTVFVLKRSSSNNDESNIVG